MVSKREGLIGLIYKIFLLFIITAVAGCATVGQGNLLFKIQANQNINPNEEGHPSSLVLTIYELNKTDNFKNADFFSLYNDPKSFLQSDLLSDQQYIVFPGQAKDVVLPIKSQTTAIGVVAAFRDLNQANWLALLPINKINNQTVNISIQPQNVQFSQ